MCRKLKAQNKFPPQPNQRYNTCTSTQRVDKIGIGMRFLVKIGLLVVGISILLLSASVAVAGREQYESLYWATIVHRERGRTGEFSPHQIALFQPDTGYVKHLPEINAWSIRVYSTPDPQTNWFVIRQDGLEYTIYPVDLSGQMGDAIFSFGDGNRLFHGFNWSPNGKWAMFSANDVFITLYRINADGTNATRIADETEYDLSASPQVLWLSNSEWFIHIGLRKLYRIHQSGSPIQELELQFPTSNLLPDSDHDWIQYATWATTSGLTIVKFNSITNETQEVSIAFTDSLQGLWWSPNGNLMGRSYSSLYLFLQTDMPSQMDMITPIFENVGFIDTLWTENNEWVAIIPNPPSGTTNYRIEIMRYDGQDPQVYIVNSPCSSHRSPQWYGSPQRLVFSQEYNGNCALFYLEGGQTEASLLKTFDEPLDELFVGETANPNWVTVSTSRQYILDLDSLQLTPLPYACCVAAWQEIPLKSDIDSFTVILGLVPFMVAVTSIALRFLSLKGKI